MIYEYGKTIFTGQTLEVYRFEKAPRVATGPRRKRPETDNNGPRLVGPRRYDSIRRLRRDFLRLVQSNLSGKGAPTFITLTFASNATLDTGLACFREFIKRAKKEFGTGISYIAVPEFQKRGAVHFHCLFWGIEDKYILHEAPWSYWRIAKPKIKTRFFNWCALKGYDPKDARGARFIQALWARGYADCVPADDSPSLAGYMAKYMQKALHDERLYGRRAYYFSRNVMRPLLYKTAAVAHHTEEILGVGIELLTERSFSTEWLGAGHYQVFKVLNHGQSDDCVPPSGSQERQLPGA